MKTVHVIGGDQATELMFERQGYKLFSGKGEPDLVCFTGGADVSPELYCQPNTSSHTNPARDLVEVGQFLKYRFLSIPMVGICRGGQFLNVMLGGSMVQDIKGHSMGYQNIYIFDCNESLLATAKVHEDHHQEMIPTKYGATLGQAEDGVREVIYYPDEDILCFQPHPEWGHKETHEIFFTAIEQLVD